MDSTQLRMFRGRVRNNEVSQYICDICGSKPLKGPCHDAGTSYLFLKLVRRLQPRQRSS